MAFDCRTFFVLTIYCFAVVQAQFDASTCGISKACFTPTDQYCFGGSCGGMGVGYKIVNDSVMELELFVEATSVSNMYVALGFSLDDMMGTDYVIECSSLDGQLPTLKYSYNQANYSNGEPSNIRLASDYSSFFMNSNVTFNDGLLYCRADVIISGTTTDPKVFKYDANQMYYLLLATGGTKDQVLVEHNHDATSVQLYLSDIYPNFDANLCGTEKGCFLPKASECYSQTDQTPSDMSVSYVMLNSSYMKIELVAPAAQATGYWVAVGFSLDSKMGNESVIECSSIGNEPVSMKFSYNQGVSPIMNVRIAGEPAVRQKFIQDTSIYQDGKIFCTGIVNVQGDSNIPEIFKYDPSVGYTLLLARGPTDSSAILHHTSTCVSEISRNIDMDQPYFDETSCQAPKLCFQPNNCYRGCNGMGFSFQMLSSTSMKVELMSNMRDTAGYVAVGLSDDNSMGNESVIECSSIEGDNNGDYSIKLSYNIGPFADGSKWNMRIPGEKDVRSQLVANEVVNFKDGLLYCSATINVGGSNVSDMIFKYDPNQAYYILEATGSTTQEGLGYHDDHVYSTTNYNLTTGVPPTSDSGFGIDPSTCNKTKGCFPSDSPIFSYKLISDTSMEIELQHTTNGYIAVGFSEDNMMGNDYVIECSSMGNAGYSLKFSYNSQNGPTNVRIDNEESIESTYFTNQLHSIENGVVYCKGTVNVGGWNGSSEVFKYTPGKTYYLLTAWGQTVATGLMKHQSIARSSAPVDLSSFTGSGQNGGLSASTVQNLIRAHACMMICAWICFIPTAMMFARFLRNSWPLVKPGGLLLWFHVHRTSNLIGITLMVASFICVLTAKNWKWTGPGSNESHWAQVHTMTGLFGLILAWIQPFVSITRCGPNTPNRPIFNWTHRLIGFSAYALATTALGVAAFHFSTWGPSSDPSLQLVLVLLPLAIIALLCVIFPIIEKLQEDEKRYHTLEMLRQVIVLISIGLLVGDVIALCIMICS